MCKGLGLWSKCGTGSTITLENVNICRSWFGVAWRAGVIATIVELSFLDQQTRNDHIFFLWIFLHWNLSLAECIVIIVDHSIVMIPEYKWRRLGRRGNETSQIDWRVQTNEYVRIADDFGNGHCVLTIFKIQKVTEILLVKNKNSNPCFLSVWWLGCQLTNNVQVIIPRMQKC